MGANVTAPHKQAVLPLLDERLGRGPRAGRAQHHRQRRRAPRAATTPTRAGWRAGCARSASTRPVEPALVLGAGGAARATVWALADLGASRGPRAESHARARQRSWSTSLQPHLSRSSLLVGPLDEAARAADAAVRRRRQRHSLGHHGAAPEVHPSCYSPAKRGHRAGLQPAGDRLHGGCAGRRARGPKMDWACCCTRLRWRSSAGPGQARRWTCYEARSSASGMRA